MTQEVYDLGSSSIDVLVSRIPTLNPLLGECVLVVTHGDLIRTLLCHYLGAPLAAWRRIRTDNGGISAVATGEGACEVKFLNALPDPARARDASHWGGHP